MPVVGILTSPPQEKGRKMLAHSSSFQGEKQNTQKTSFGSCIAARPLLDNIAPNQFRQCQPRISNSKRKTTKMGRLYSTLYAIYRVYN